MKKSKVFKVYLIYFICMTIFCVMKIVNSFGLLNFAHKDIADIIYTCIVQIGIIVVLPFTLYTLFVHDGEGFGGTFKETKFNRKIDYRVVLLSFGIGILAFFINIAVSTICNGLITALGYKAPTIVATEQYTPLFTGWARFVIDVITIAVLPSICEEFLHRGILLNGTREIGTKKAILISSLVFGLLHFNINQFFFAFTIGLLLGLVCVVSKSIYPCIIIHFTNNFLSTYIDFAEREGLWGKNFYNYLNGFLKSSNPIITFLACFAFLALVIILLILLISKIFRIQTLGKVQRAIDSMYTADEKAKTDDPIVIEKSRMLQEMLEYNTTLNLNYEQMKSPLDIVLPKDKNVFDAKLEDNVFLISTIVLGGVITLFTFLWGLL